MENDERTEIIDDDYNVEEESGNNVSIWKPLLGIFGVIAAGIGGVLFFRKRRKNKYVELSTVKTLDDNQEDEE